MTSPLYPSAKDQPQKMDTDIKRDGALTMSYEADLGKIRYGTNIELSRTEKSLNLVLYINKSHLLATAHILVALGLNYSHICRGSLQANLIIWATSVPSFI